jgi:Proteobacterial transcriptional regulator-like domain
MDGNGQRWGVPDWTSADCYPSPEKTSDRVWRWEFLRRRDDYRRAWMDCSAKGIKTTEETVHAVGDDCDAARLRFGVSVIHDPCRAMSDDLLLRASVFWPIFGVVIAHQSESHFQAGAFLAERHPSLVDRGAKKLRDRAKADEDAGLVDYRFDLKRPLEPQLKKAKRHLQGVQEEFYGNRNTSRPSRERWPLYLRVLDARDAGASWSRITNELGFPPNSNKARRTHELALRVQLNFPI